MQFIPIRSVAASLLLTSISGVYADETSPSTDDEIVVADFKISEVTVYAERVANDSPASSYATAATALRFDPLTELQSRGIAEGQSDVTVRGGLFENTGFKIGAVTITDPQTGHYVAEIPVDPVSLTAPAVHKGIDAAVEGFNSAIATVSYSLGRVQDGGQVSVGFGNDNLNFQSLRFGNVSDTRGSNELGMALSFARSEGDGSVEFGDHDFSRLNLQLQHVTDAAQTDAIFAYQDKFYGWPGAYTGFATLPEIDDTQTTLLLLNHRRNTADGYLEFGAYYRRLEDDYDFNRTTAESGAPGSFEHETKVFGLGVQGLHEAGRANWRYGAQFTSDELARSTDLTNGSFNKRRYVTASVVPSIDVELASGSILTWRGGLTVDYSNRDSNEVSPLLGLTLRRSDVRGSNDFSIEYAATSQLPGYTALNSGVGGLFGGNPQLGREVARQLSASYTRESINWTMRATVFAREDDDLVDWTYDSNSPFARQANPVDIDVLGFEIFYIKNWEAVDLAVGLTSLDKDADYGSATVDASFYALNFARNRATLALTWQMSERFELRLDNEYRDQETNPLRTGDDSTYVASASLQWNAAGTQGLRIALVVDNITDSEFQTFPGTPASGRQASLSASYAW